MSNHDTRLMRSAIALGSRGLGRTSPNPSVGCLLVRDGIIIGRGHTQDGGRPHAEQVALAAAKSAYGGAEGAAAYVTLEPCAHAGQTPACANTLIEAGVVRVVIGIEDPDPRTHGKGVEMLRAAGVAVETGLCASEATELHLGFLSRIHRQRPALTLKLATSLDGKIATSAGESKWITGTDARNHVQALRARHDAVLVGVGTVMADDPMLTSRLPGSRARTMRVIADSHLRTPLTSQLVRTVEQSGLILLVSEDVDQVRAAAFEEAGVEIISLPGDSNGVLDLTRAMNALAGMGINSVLSEGGGRLASSLIRADLVDRLVWYSAGLLMGNDGLPSLAAYGLASLEEARRWELLETRPVGTDIMTLWGRRSSPDAVDKGAASSP